MLNAEQFLFSTWSRAASNHMRPNTFLQVTKKISTRKQKRKKLIPKNMVDLSSTRFLSSPNGRLISPSKRFIMTSTSFTVYLVVKTFHVIIRVKEMYGYIVQEVPTNLMLNHGINKQLYHFRIIKIFLSKIKLLEPK